VKETDIPLPSWSVPGNLDSDRLTTKMIKLSGIHMGKHSLSFLYAFSKYYMVRATLHVSVLFLG